jgi:peptide deformylase
MALLDIITPKDPVLRQRAEPVTNFHDDELQKLIDNMIETMLAAPGVGLAAPQVAVNKRLIVVRLPDDEGSKEEYGEDAGVLYVVINPEITRTSREQIEGVEACLSIPGYFGKVDRFNQVLIKGFDRHGNPIKVKARGWLARVFQHEIDHLDGVLFIDHASELWREKVEDEHFEDPLQFDTLDVSDKIREENPR